MIKIIYITFLSLVIQINLCAQTVKDSYSSSSVLSSGKWFRIAVLRDGIYRIDYSKLIEMGVSDPGNPKIFANNFGQLSYLNDDPRPDDLTEVKIYTSTGTDGIFNEGDYLLFYGQGTGRWKFDASKEEFDFLKHNYSDTAFYFLTSSTTQGKRISEALPPQGSPNYFSSESDALFIHEVETENLIKSGREWFQPVSTIQGIVINPQFKDLLTDEKVKFSIRVAGRSPVPSLFRLYEGTTIRQNIQVRGVNMLDYTGTFAEITDSSGSAFPSSSSPLYEIKYFNNGEYSARGWIDFVKFQGRKQNYFRGPVIFLTDSRSAGPGMITEFSVNNDAQNPVIWDITDPSNPEVIHYSTIGQELKFSTATETLRSFVIFNESSVYQPFISSGILQNQDLHGSSPAEMIIVTHPLFRDYAEKLAAIHLENSGLISIIVTPREIYNEFSGGTPDIAAIRNFLRMKFMKQSGSQTPLRYLLLFGDGSFENRTPPPGNPNFIPTYQSQNSNVVTSSFTSDDFYGLLEDGEGEADGTEDIGIGRLPVSDTTQAGTIIRKITSYIDDSNTGNWKNVICLTADDEDGNTHVSDAEGLSQLINDSVPFINIDKIYLDAFRQVTSANGQSYPDVSTAINNRINSGALIFNYTGHGNENGLAHERVVKTEDINSWKNGSRLPLFITATCEFSRFDDIDLNIITREMSGKTSAGEMVLLNSNGGGIALMSTTRVVYSAPNYFLNRNIYRHAFTRDSSGNALRLGDIIRLAKISSGSGSNKRNFSLLGDPAIRLAYPWHGMVVTDSINHIEVTGTPDSLRALAMVTVSGHIEDMDGNSAINFNGIVTPLVFDKVSEIKTLANDGGLPIKFDLRNNILFSGKTTATGGKFRFTFIVPRDIDYSFGQGKISYYASDETTDITGYFSDIIVGGFAETTAADTTGPLISLFLNDTLFRSGGITDQNPRMLAIITDSGGINTTGSGIGHDLTGYLDNDRNTSFVLNSYFENDFDNYMKGKIVYDLSELVRGNHTLTVKAWDNYNNSSEESILFIVETDGKFILRNLINYPNPVVNETNISAEHNRPGEEYELTITIFDMSGRIIRILKTSDYTTGYRLAPVNWDGNTEGGKRVGRGIYPYRVTISTGNNETASATGRMIIL